jgi:putative ATP-dependent endonuclease of OLD family
MYLARVHIQHYKGIRDLEVRFDPDVNIIIGENASCKSALIDALRLLYNLGEQRRDLYVSNEDFFIDSETYKPSDKFEIGYQFRGLSERQKGAFYDYMVVSENPDDDYAQIVLVYTIRENRNPAFNYYTGKKEGQRADPQTFELFQHYYLGALRDSTRNLLRSRGNILGALIQGMISRNKSEDNFEGIVTNANQELGMVQNSGELD